MKYTDDEEYICLSKTDFDALRKGRRCTVIIAPWCRYEEGQVFTLYECTRGGKSFELTIESYSITKDYGQMREDFLRKGHELPEIPLAVTGFFKHLTNAYFLGLIFKPLRQDDTNLHSSGITT